MNNGVISYDNPLYNTGEEVIQDEENPYNYQDVKPQDTNEHYIVVEETEDMDV